MNTRDITQFTPAERMARCHDKRQHLLNLLADEIYISTELTGLALGLKRTAAYQTLAGMEKAGLLVRDSICLQGRDNTLWGISALGLAHAGRELDQPIYEIGRVSWLAVNHHFTTLRVRLLAEKVGWQNWQSGRLLYNRKFPKVPDAVGVSPAGEPVAFEIELNPKTVKRYRDIVAGHLLAMKSGHWSRVIYLSPAVLVPRMQRLFQALGHVNVPGMGKAVLTAAHLARFQFRALETWPDKPANEIIVADPMGKEVC